MIIIELLFLLTMIYMAVCMMWRILCLFRKKGSCKFTNCPFRKNYMNTSCMHFLDSGCTKCPPTDEELEVYRHSLEGVMENLAQKKDG